MSTTTLPNLGGAFNSYADYVEHLLNRRPNQAVAAQVVTIVAGLEEALLRQARDETEIELRLTAMETTLLARLETIEATLSKRVD